MSTPLDLSTVAPDFDSLTSALQNNLKIRDSWVDLYPEATGETLIEFGAAVGTMDAWAIEKAFKEAFLGTANIDTSIYAGARFLGVRISRKLPGTQTCSLSRTNLLNLPVNESLLIPAYSQFYINGNIPFFNRTEINFLNYSKTLDTVYLQQGTVLTKQYVSDGTSFQQLIIPSLTPMSISDVDIMVTVNGTPWSIIYDGLWHYGFTDNVVADATLGSGDVILQFGNGINGSIPPQGATITVTYAETLGSKQGLISSGSTVTGSTQSGYSISGTVTKLASVSLVTTNLSGLAVTLSSTTDPVAKAYLPTGNVWDISYVGMQLEADGGLALITGVSQNIANLSVVNPFTSTLLVVGSWSVTIPSSGLDEKSSSYYKILAPSLGRSKNRAVSPEDHSAIFDSYPGISDCLIRTEKDLVQTLTIAKTAAVIAQEQAAGVYDGTTTYQIQVDPNPALYSVVWVSLLTSTGLALTSTEKADLLTWFSTRQFIGSRIKLQDPIKTTLNLQIEIYCLKTANTDSVSVLVQNAIRAMFSTDKPMLSKKMTTTDINRILNAIVGLDYYELYILIPVTGSGSTSTYTPRALADSDLIPSSATIDAQGMPIAPGYLYLNNLVINPHTTDR